jgi:3-deoxy-alpha-D-manno-octulosonate 8-oxidase
MAKRRHADAPFIFLVDDVFEDRELATRIPRIFNDQLIFICADREPSTEQVDALVEKIKDRFEELPSGIVGIGGGTLLDLAKAVSIMMNNKGSSSMYQGWDLVNKPSIYHAGIPTISGTGAEVSRTAVLLGPEKKLGINSDHTTFDQVLLDPDLAEGVDKKQWFYTGMDCYIHCIESLNGTYLNAFSQSYGEKALELCMEVFLHEPTPEESRDKLMMASWHGGMSIAYSQVGVAHAMSYGLGFLLGVRHGIGNCLVFQHLGEFYPEGVALFEKMRQKHGIDLPKGICANLDDSEFDTMVSVAMGMVPLWENALGEHWHEVITPEKLEAIYRRI